MKCFLTALAILLVLTGSAVAGNPDANQCNANKLAGTFIRLRPNAFSGSGLGVTDQLILTSDGAAYWYQTTAFDFFLTGTTFIPQVGSWLCIDKTTVVVTTFGANYVPNGGGDIVKSTLDKFSQKLTIVDTDTLQPIVRVDRTYSLTDDPVTGTPLNTTVTTSATSPYRRFKASAADVP